LELAAHQMPSIFWDVPRCRLVVGYRNFGTAKQSKKDFLNCLILSHGTDRLSETSVNSCRNKSPNFEEEGNPHINQTEVEAWNLISQLTVTLPLLHQERGGVKLFSNHLVRLGTSILK